MSRNPNAAEDDVDEFLYGSSSADQQQQSSSAAGNEWALNESSDSHMDHNTSSDTAGNDDNKHGMDLDEDAPRREAEDDDEDSDDDLEIILETDNEPPSSSQPQNEGIAGDASPAGEKASSLVNIKPGQQGGKAPANATAQTSSSTITAKANPSVGGINLEAVGEYNGQPITEVDLDSFEDKPWRKPGADITDYFNYGFNEVTWRAYCAQQKMLRESKKMMGDMDMNEFMMGMMGMNGMPPQGMMEGNRMPPNMMGMPPMGMPPMGMPPMGMPPMGMNSPAGGAGRGGSGNRNPGGPGRGGNMGFGNPSPSGGGNWQ